MIQFLYKWGSLALSRTSQVICLHTWSNPCLVEESIDLSQEPKGVIGFFLSALQKFPKIVFCRFKGSVSQPPTSSYDSEPGILEILQGVPNKFGSKVSINPVSSEIWTFHSSAKAWSERSFFIFFLFFNRNRNFKFEI